MIQHTPGPWATNADAKVYSVGRKEWNRTFNTEMPEYVASVGGAGKDTAKSNARLIAAAPELLQHLRALVVRCDEAATRFDGLESCGDFCEIADTARALLARIEGQE